MGKFGGPLPKMAPRAKASKLFGSGKLQKGIVGDTSSVDVPRGLIEESGSRRLGSPDRFRVEKVKCPSRATKAWVSFYQPSCTGDGQAPSYKLFYTQASANADAKRRMKHMTKNLQTCNPGAKRVQKNILWKGDFPRGRRSDLFGSHGMGGNSDYEFLDPPASNIMDGLGCSEIEEGELACFTESKTKDGSFVGMIHVFNPDELGMVRPAVFEELVWVQPTPITFNSRMAAQGKGKNTKSKMSAKISSKRQVRKFTLKRALKKPARCPKA